MTTHSVTSTPAHTRSSALHIALWVAQVALFVLFAYSGYIKATMPVAPLSQMIPWVTDVPLALLRFIGIAELAGAFGVLLPALLRIKPQLTALAAAGLAIVMILAAGFHLMRGELPGVVTTLLFGTVAAFVAWGRFAKAPIPPRA